MKNLYHKTNMMNTSIITTNMDSKSLLKLLKESLNNEKIIDFKEVEKNIEALTGGVIINPNIFLNLKIDDNVDESKVIEDLTNKSTSKNISSIEIISGIDTIKALEHFENIEVIVNLTINIDEANKISLFDFLNRYADGKALLNRKLELGLLDSQYMFIYRILENVNDIENSPLKDRIHFSGDKIQYQLNPKSLVTCIESSRILELLKIDTIHGTENDVKVVAKLIANALIAYEEVYKDVYTTKNNPILKLCDIRYVICLLPALYRYCEIKRVYLTVDTISDIFKIVKREDLDIINNYLNSIKSESATKALAKAHSKIISRHSKTSYNPLEMM